MASALKTSALLALAGKRALLSDHPFGRQLFVPSNCNTNICGRRLTDAKACAGFGNGKKNCKGECLPGYTDNSGVCVIEVPDDLSTIDHASILSAGMDDTRWTSEITERLKTQKENARRWYKDAFTSHKAKTANIGKTNRVLRKELRLDIQKDNDFSTSAKNKLNNYFPAAQNLNRKYYLKIGPENSGGDDTCATNSKADDDSCITTLLAQEADTTEKNDLGCDDCWQVGGTTLDDELMPVVKQKWDTANSRYIMQCWDKDTNQWLAEEYKLPGDTMSCTVYPRTVTVVVDSLTLVEQEDAQVPEYDVSSSVPRGSADKTLDVNFDPATMKAASVKKVGNDIAVDVTMTGDLDSSNTNYNCVLEVDLVHDLATSDASLQGTPTLGASVTDTEMGVEDGVANTFRVLVTPSTYPMQGEKLHVGQLGVSIKARVKCPGVAGEYMSQDGITAQTGIELFEVDDDTKSKDHKFYYDLVADGTTLTPEDSAGAASGTLSEGVANDGKRSYAYSAAFTHAHKQIAYPETSISGRTPADHFANLPDPADAECAWDASEAYVAELEVDVSGLRTRGWMGAQDTARPTAVYGAWQTGDCTAGVCTAYKKETTVDGANAYLPFDKPLLKYYQTDKAPKVTCVSRIGAAGTTTSLVPDLAADSAPAMAQQLVVKFDTVTAVDCPKDAVDATICENLADDATTGNLFGLIYTIARVNEDFTNLLDQKYDFDVALTCTSSNHASDPCSPINIDDGPALIGSLVRSTVSDTLEAKAVAVESLTFNVPTKYGITFNTYSIVVSANTAVANSNKYRTPGDFAVTMDTVDTDETITWIGGETAEKGFLADGLTPSSRTAQIVSSSRISIDAKTGYFKANALFVDGVMTPFNDIADIAATTTAARSAAADSSVCGDDTSEAASVYCKSNGFEAFRCLASSLDVKYTVVTPTSDSRFPSDTAIAVKSYSEDAIASPDAAAMNFQVTAPTAVVGGTGVRAGAATLDLTTATDLMGTDDLTFTREAGDGVMTYNCETTPGRMIAYNTNVAAPCGDIADYILSSQLEAHYVYMNTQIAQTDTPDSWTTSEWHVQDSSSVRGSGSSIELKVIISNTEDEYHLPANKVEIVPESVTVVDGAVCTNTFKVQDCAEAVSDWGITGAVFCEFHGADYYNNDLTHMCCGSAGDVNSCVSLNDNEIRATCCNGPTSSRRRLAVTSSAQPRRRLAVTGSAQLKPNSCVTTDEGTPQEERSCIIQYNLDDEYLVSYGKSCGDQDEPECPKIGYKLGARVRSGDVTGAFGEAGACGTPATVLTPIDTDLREHTLAVTGNARAYDGVIDVHVKIGNQQELSDAMATETQHNVAVPGKDGAAMTILDLNSNDAAHITASRNVAFKIKYLQTGKGARTFTIAGLNVPANLNLPKLKVCSPGDYAAGNCVTAGEAGTTAFSSADGTNNDLTGEFYVSLGNDMNFDVCANTNMGLDPYTVYAEDGVTPVTRYLGFSIQVDYLTGGEGLADTGVPHNYYFAVKCPQKSYSLNIKKPGAANTRVNIGAGGNAGLVDKEEFAVSHNNEIELLLFFSGRSQEGNKQPLIIQTNPDVEFKSADPTQISGNDIGDDIAGAQAHRLRFKQPCLFTTIVLQSKQVAGATDSTFTFKIQCPRFSGVAVNDDLSLEYTITDTTFGVGGGSVTVTEPADIDDFKSVVTGLVGTACTGNPTSTCTFATGAGGTDQVLDGSSDSIASWFTYLEECGFTDDGNGLYTGTVQRKYTRTNLVGTDVEYCGGRQVSFGVQMTGSHTATIAVENAKEMDFAVQVEELAWVQSGCAAGQHRIRVKLFVYRRPNGEQIWTKATATTITDASLSGFFDANQALAYSNGELILDGQCTTLFGDESNCNDFETTREINFGAEYLSNGLDYRAQLEVDLSLTCPRGIKSGSSDSQIPLVHYAKCAGYGSDIVNNCDLDGSVAQVKADEQVELQLVINDPAFSSHNVDPPTYSISGGASGTVTSLTGEYVGEDSSGTAIPLVQNSDTGEENSKVTLRALAFAGQTVSITWQVERVANGGSRRLVDTITYQLGGDESSQSIAGFRVVSALRDGDSDTIYVNEDPVPVNEASEDDAEDKADASHITHTHTHAEPHHDGWGLTIFVIFGAGLFLAVILFFAFSTGEKTVVHESNCDNNSGFKSRFYNYSRVDTDLQDSMESGNRNRNRFLKKL